MPHHRALGVIDLALFGEPGDDDGVSLCRVRPAQLADEAADTGVLGGKAVIVDEVAVDRHGIAAPAERGLDQFAIRLAGAGAGSRPGGSAVSEPVIPGGSGSESVDTSLASFGVASRRCRGSRMAIAAALRYAPTVSRRTPVAASMRLSVQPSRPSARTCCRLSSPKMLAIEGPRSSRLVNVLGYRYLTGRVSVSTTGRFWLSTEDLTAL